MEIFFLWQNFVEKDILYTANNLDPWFEAHGPSVDILVLVPWSMDRGRGCPLTSLEPGTSDLALVLGEGFLRELARVLNLVEGFLGKLKLVPELVDGFLKELKLVEFFYLLVQQPCMVPRWIGSLRQQCDTSTVLDNFKRLKTELTPFLTYKKQKIIIWRSVTKRTSYGIMSTPKELIGCVATFSCPEIPVYLKEKFRPAFVGRQDNNGK